ncbi:hypothetical protein AKJ63_02135, partial [candidate division MSBL1 archaeon SCGC-AAA259D18]
MKLLYHVGIDDTDSKEGMCTTYIGAVVLDELEEVGIGPVASPHLIRLNPNWKHKTRGNCAVSFALDVDEEEVSKVEEVTLDKVGSLAEIHMEGTDPGVVFLEGDEVPPELEEYTGRVIREVVTMEEAEELAGEVGAELHKFGIGRGVIGALAAIGHPLEEDYTYELIAYRTEKNRGTPRRISGDSVRAMDEETYPETFDNLDLETGEIRITPHTPGPILYGIRSETPEAAVEAQGLVVEEEPVERTLLYKTNQGTDEHLHPATVEDIEPYRSVIVEGVVSEGPETITGGHVFFSIEDETGEVGCAAFEPTRRFRDVVRSLVPGDRVKVYGGVKEKPDLPLTINLEKIEILELEPLKEETNPVCEQCGRRMTSAGRGKGYVCR